MKSALLMAVSIIGGASVGLTLYALRVMHLPPLTSFVPELLLVAPLLVGEVLSELIAIWGMQLRRRRLERLLVLAIGIVLACLLISGYSRMRFPGTLAECLRDSQFHYGVVATAVAAGLYSAYLVFTIIESSFLPAREGK